MAVGSGSRQEKEAVRERLAEYAHEAWSGWMKYLFEKCDGGLPMVLSALEDGSLIIPKEFVDRWRRQMNIPYEDLPKNEKKSDRDEADRMIEIFNGE